MSKKLRALSAASMLLAGAAAAADLPRRSMAPAPVYVPAFTWTGFYLGVSGGGSYSDSDIATIGTAPGNIAAVAANARPQSVSIDSNGFLIGGTLGYNVQYGSFVFGVEGDISYTDNDESTVQSNPITFGANAPGTLRNTFRQEMEYLARIRGRVGVAFDRVMVYGTGGAAFASINSTADFSSPGLGPTQFFGSRDETVSGYTIGGGVEWAVPTSVGLFGSSAVTFKAEYLYYELDESSVTVAPASSGVPGGVGSYISSFENEGHIFRGGINVKF